MLEEGSARGFQLHFAPDEITRSFQRLTKDNNSTVLDAYTGLHPQLQAHLGSVLLFVKQRDGLERYVVGIVVQPERGYGADPAVVFYVSVGDKEVEPVYIIDQQHVT